MATRTLAASIPESSSVGRHLAFLPIPFSIQMLGAEPLKCLKIKKKKVLEIQSIFIKVFILFN